MIQLLPIVLPVATQWVEWHERKILRQGAPLSPVGLADAVRMGVAHPEKIRLMTVERIPMLNSLFMRILARFAPAVSANTVGLSLRYGIYVREPWSHERNLIAHECVHTGQYERLGSVGAFLLAYFTECLETGYSDAPMEQEAILRSASLD
ncbi:MAG: hypothetical protein V4584_05440 [Verrucomicrobiota bacterium]